MYAETSKGPKDLSDHGVIVPEPTGWSRKNVLQALQDFPTPLPLCEHSFQQSYFHKPWKERQNLDTQLYRE